MKRSFNRRFAMILVLVGLALAVYPMIQTVAQADPVATAWERLQAAGSYRFESLISQTLIPRALPEMIGQQEQVLNYQMQGAAVLPDQAYIEMRVFNNTAEAPQVALIRDQTGTYMQSGGEITPVDTPFGSILPAGDWMGYLSAAENVQVVGPTGGETGETTHYQFDIDGPRLADYVRQQAAASLQQSGAPAGLEATTSPILARLTGMGELWVGPDGLPTKQVLNLSIPQVSGEYDVKLHMVVGMSDIGQVKDLPRVVPGKDGDWLLQSPASVPPSGGGGASIQPAARAKIQIPPAAAVISGVFLVIAGAALYYRRRPRQAYAAVAVLTMITMVFSPVLQPAQAASFIERQADPEAGGEEPAVQLAKAFGLGELTSQPAPAAANLPVSQVQPQAVQNQGAKASGRSARTVEAPLASGPEGTTDLITTCGEGDPGEDFDGDGLSDMDEACYGTDPYSADTDHDGITDTLEIQGFDLNGVHYTSNALKADSNGDGFPDGEEWPAPIGSAPNWDSDGDGIPNIWEDDNDNDGVVDSLDYSPFSKGEYSSVAPVSIEVVDRNRQGTQYIEFQVQPENQLHLNYSTTYLDWPDNDIAGQITSRITGTQDLRLAPFLDVTTTAVPNAALRRMYGLLLTEEAGQTPHLLIPLFPQKDNGVVNSYIGKVAYGPQDMENVLWSPVKMVWLVQQTNMDGQSGVVFRYEDSFRLTGMQVTSSDRYEMGVFGTPGSPLEDKPLFKLLYGMSTTYMEFGSLEGQQPGNTALQEVAARFAAPGSYPISYTWGITETVVSTIEMYTHQDQMQSQSGAQIEAFLNENFARTDQLCVDADGLEFECAGIVIGTEERLGTVPAASLSSAHVRLDMTGAARLTTRGLRYQMYQRTGAKWEAVSFARTIEIIEKRYADQWPVSLAQYQQAYPNLIENDLRFATYLPYQTWNTGRQSPIAIEGITLVPAFSEDEEELINAVGLLTEKTQFIFDLFMEISNVHTDLNEMREGLKYLEFGNANEYFTVEQISKKWHEYNQDIPAAQKRFKTMAITASTIQLAALTADVASMVCSKTGGCNETVLKGFVAVTSFADFALESYELFSEIKELSKPGSFKAPWAAMSKCAKALAIVGLVLEIGLIWAQFALTKGGKTSGFVFDLALGTAIVATVFAIIAFILLAIPGVNIVAGIIMLLVGIVDLLLWLFGSDFSVMNAVMSFFFKVDMVTKIVENSATYLGGGSGLLFMDLGLVPGNTYQMWDTFTATIEGSAQLHNTSAAATWAGVSVPGAVTATNHNGAVQSSYSDSSHRVFWNSVGVDFRLETPQVNAPVQINTNIHFRLRYEKCTLLFICWYDTDTQDIADTIDGLKLDVLPIDLTGLWEWDELGNPDRDGDGLVNASDPYPDAIDGDGDGLSDAYEVENFTALGTDPQLFDSDDDGLDDGREIALNTAPNNPDTDGDGLLDGEEVAGWDVQLPSGQTYRVYSDPLDADADGDALGDGVEADNHTSPYAFNQGATIWGIPRPRLAAPDGQVETYLAPGSAMSYTLAVYNTGTWTITSTLQVSATLDHLLDLQVVHAGVMNGTVPPVEPCPEPNCYQWDFGAVVMDQGVPTTPYLLAPGDLFTATLTATTAGPSGTGVLSYSLPYSDTTQSGQGQVFIDEDNPTAYFLGPLDGQILSGEYFVIGGYGLDETTWVSQVDLTIDGAPTTIVTPQGNWAYTWELPGDGVYPITARARDPFGHESAAAQVGVWVDNTPPGATIDLEEGAVIHPQDDQVTVTGTAFDNLSGLVRLLVSVDGGNWQEAALDPAPDPVAGFYPLNATWTYSWTISAAAQGRHTLAVRAVDRAGLKSATGQVGFIIDSVPPRDDLLTRLDEQPAIVPAAPTILLQGYANDAGNVPLPPRPAALDGKLDVVADATVWLSPDSIYEDDGGVSMAWAGDLDGDGRADLVLGFPAAENGAGRVVVLYGHYGDWALPPEVEPLSDQWTSFVGAPGAGLGAHLAAAGDVNGDGLEDLLIGDPANQRTFLVYSRPAPLGWGRALDGVDRSVRYTLFDQGETIAPAGDMNGDGFADLWIGNSNRVSLILGYRELELQQTMAVDELAAAVVTRPANGTVLGTGDVNGDQLDDWVVTDPANHRLYLLSGSAALSAGAGQVIDPASDGLRLAALNSVGFGIDPVVPAGDVNGDELADFLYSSGSAPRLVLGRSSGAWNYSYEFNGFAPEPGGFLAAPGDVNRDGLDDLVLGTNDQQAYLVLGRTNWSGVGVEATLTGVAEAASAPFSAGADLNCDGSSDLLLLPAEAGVSQLLAAEQPFAEQPRIQQAALPVSTIGSGGATPGSGTDKGPQGIASDQTFYVDDDYCEACPNDGHTWGVDAFNSIQAAVDVTHNSTGDTIQVGPGVYAPFSLDYGHRFLTITGVNPDAVFVDGYGSDYAVNLANAWGVTLANLTLRNAASLVVLNRAGEYGVSQADMKIVLDHLVGYGFTHAIAMDRSSTVTVSRSTWVTGQSGETIFWVDPAAPPAAPPQARQWVSTSPMSDGREGHTATLLPDGRVLVVGGEYDGMRTSAELYDPADQTWTGTGLLNTARAYHTATLLPDGRVLVAGGAVSYWESTASAELYDPATGTFTPTLEAMNQARARHTATLLPNGKVLVAGGTDFSVDLASAELFDPATETWTSTDDMDQARAWHTATLLPNGKVLVAGGYLGGAPLSGAELFDPAAETWTSTAALNQGRFKHTATLLLNGKVLVAGGTDLYNSLASAELFNPATGTWSVTGSMSEYRNSQTATLLPDGRVLAAGGLNIETAYASTELYNPATGVWTPSADMNYARLSHTATRLPDGRVLVAGGGRPYTYIASAELNEPLTNTWVTTGSMAFDRDSYTATRLQDGRVLAAGGRCDSCAGTTPSAELYDPVTGVWTATDGLNTARHDHTATLLLNGKVLVAGGYGDSYDPIISAELYDPATGAWTATGELKTARYNHTATLLPDGMVLVAGGYDNNGYLASAELYDPAAGTWTATGPLNTSRGYHTATRLLNGKVLVAGGYGVSFDPITSAEVYNPATGTWTPAGDMNTDRGEHTATLLPDGKVLAAGGYNSMGATSSAELYDPLTDAWTPTTAMSFSRANHTATLLPDGRALVAGGYTFDNNLASPEVYDPATGTWTTTGEISPGRAYHTATLLPGGSVLVAGGRDYFYSLNSAELYLAPYPIQDRLVVEDSALAARTEVAAPAWLNLESDAYDFNVRIQGETQWAADSPWTPAAAAPLTLAQARFLDMDQDVYRLQQGSALSGGYIAYHPDVFVFTDEQACLDEGRCGVDLVWGDTAFSSLQAAIATGAQRVLVRPGIFEGPVYLVNGLDLIGSGAEMTILRMPPGATGWVLVTAEGLARVTLGSLTLDGQGLYDGLWVENGVRSMTLARTVLRDTLAALALAGEDTRLEIVNNLFVDNQDGIFTFDCASLDLRNTILSGNDVALSLTSAGCSSLPNYVYRYNDYWDNGTDLLIDGIPVQSPGTGEIRANPRFTDPGAHDYRPLNTSPVIDAGDPSDHIPPGTGGRIDIGTIEYGQAAIAVDDDYCATCLNDGLAWGVNAFATIQDGLDAAGALVIALGEARTGQVTVGVGPGRYVEDLTLYSYVTLAGIDPDEVTVAGSPGVNAVSINNVVSAEVRGLHITSESGPNNYGIGVNGSREVRIAYNLIEGNARGIVFDGAATGEVAFNTIADNPVSGVYVIEEGTHVEATNNIIAGSNNALVGDDQNRIHSNYNLLFTVDDYQGTDPGDEDLHGDPLFTGSGTTPYHLQEASPAVDSADPEAAVPVGGGSRADRGYSELRAVPLALLFGQQGISCAEGNSGIASLEAALVPVSDAGLPITATLPGAWVPVSLDTPGEVASYWSLEMLPTQEGLHRIYTRATDAAGNQEDDPFDWYSGAVIVDSVPPVVTWIEPPGDLSVEDIALHLQAAANDWLDTGSGVVFNVARVYFEVDGTLYPATWVGEIPLPGQARTFEAVVPLQIGPNPINAVAVDGAGHATSSPILVTSTATGNVAAITSILDGSATHQGLLELHGVAHFDAGPGTPTVLVQVDGQPPLAATLENPAGPYSPWSIQVELLGEGDHTLVVSAMRVVSQSSDSREAFVEQPASSPAAQGPVHLWLDLTPPDLAINAPPEGSLVQETVTLSGAAYDTGSGLASLEVSLDGVLWEPAVLNGSDWSFTWTAPIKEPGIPYRAMVRAVDAAGNETVQTRTFVVDGDAPGGIEPIEFNFPAGTYLEGLDNQLVVNWAPAIDSSALVTVTVLVDQAPDSIPDQVVGGLSYAATLNAGGEWYFHLMAQDAAGNAFLYHEGPWRVSSFETGQMIALDGTLDTPNGEWQDATELLDDDERALAGLVPDLFAAERQRLYATWDIQALYLGWRGAWWDLNGTLWAFVDSAPGGSTTPPAAGLPALPMAADFAIEIDGADQGTLWAYNGSGWVVQAYGLEFAQGSSGDTEIKLLLNLAGSSSLSVAALALDDAGVTWSAFPTTNPLGQLVEPYHWEGYLGAVTPNAGQPVGTTAVIAVENPPAPEGFWGSGSSIPYTIEVTNWENRAVAGLQLHFATGAGLVPMPPAYLPELAPRASVPVDVLDLLVADVGSLTEVENTISLQLSGTILNQAVLHHRVDGLPPVVQINVPLDHTLGAGRQLVSGSAEDAGAGVASVEVLNTGQPASGGSPWTAWVDIPAGAASYTLNILATDAVGNHSTASQTFSVDTLPPALTYTLPPLIGGDEFALFGSSSDGESRVVQVEVQVDGSGYWLPAQLAPQPDEAGEQSWLYLWDLPQADYTVHTLQARAVDVAGNVFTGTRLTATIDSVAPVITVTQALTQVLLVDYLGGNPEAAPIVTGTVRDGGGVSAVYAHIRIPNNTELTVPADLTLPGFSITPVFVDRVAGEYTYTLEAVDVAGNSRVLGTFTLNVVYTQEYIFLPLVLHAHAARKVGR